MIYLFAEMFYFISSAEVKKTTTIKLTTSKNKCNGFQHCKL